MEPIKEEPGFAHLHVHSEYSLLDGMSKIKKLVKKVKKAGMNACAITDHGVGYGLADFYNVCKAEGIKPILGCECYEAPGSRFDKSSGNEERYYHLILLVKNEIGYKNLCHLISRSNMEGFYYKPRIDFELLEQFHEGLICMSACLAGRVPKMILKGLDTGDMSEAEQTILKYKNLFGDDYYLEIQNHGIVEEQKVANELVRFSNKFGIKLVCTNDCHYVDHEDKEAHEYLLCLQTKKTIDDPDRMVYYGDYSVKTEAEMRQLFPSLPEAFDNTMEIADKCNFEFEFGNYRMPKVHIPKEYGKDYFRYLEDEAWKGWEKRYPLGHMERETARKDLEYELSVVKQMGFAEYFIDTRKTIMWARSHGILVGPGRGSAAGSRMCYCLGITDIDPIPYNLLFERFLNPERISMPDIDVDYDYSHKDEVIAFEAEDNGKDHFSKIQTFTTMNAKGIVRDIARVAGYPPSVGSKIAGFIPKDPKMTLDKAWELDPELQNYINSDEGLKKLWEIARKLEGTKKAPSTHACGHIPTPVPCEDLYPVSVDSETGYLVCQYNMSDAEHLGNLKKDLLMLRNLTIIDTAQREIKEKYDVDIPLWTDEILNDKKALELIASGDTNGIFQLESEGMKDFMKKLQPSCFEDIIAGVALYRPGPMEYIPNYIQGKHDPASIQYLTPELEDILNSTYGVIVFQEQVMQIVRKLAGFSMGRADLIRKAMGKKKQEIMDEEAPRFICGDKDLKIDGCVNRGISEDIAQKIWDQMVDFAKYAFNKSHAAAYAAVSMQTAYLKAHYPLEFAAGLLTSVMDKTEKLVIYLNEYRMKKIEILPPDINSCETDFTVVGSSLCYGLASVKGIGKAALKEVINERKANGAYKDFYDFIKRNPEIDKKMLDSLAGAGALDFTGLTRHTLIESGEKYLDGKKKDDKKQLEGQMNLFDFLGDDPESRAILSSDMLPNLPEYSKNELLKLEKEATGIYISGHPMEQYAEMLECNYITDNSCFMDDPEVGFRVYDGDNVRIAGTISSIKKIFTKKDSKPMAFVGIEDPVNTVDVVVFPKVYSEIFDKLQEDRPVIVSGKVSVKDDKASVLADRIFFLDGDNNIVWVRFRDAQDFYQNSDDLNSIADRHPGTSRINVAFSSTGNKESLQIHISSEEAALEELKAKFGAENIAVTKAKYLM